MITRMVEEHIGEYLGPVDWSYDFTQYGISERCVESGKAMLRDLESGGEWEATTDGGWPRVGWHRVIRVGMYDGWPYWKPVPSVQVIGTLGSEWHSWSCLSEIRKL
jgi:hypothetical protein